MPRKVMRPAVPRPAFLAISVLSTLLAAIAGCGVAVGRTAISSHGQTAGIPTGTPAVQAGLPLPTQAAKRLPAGAFYLLAGPNPGSLNLWEVSNSGHETKLTNNRLGYGISSFAASAAGIVMADASNGFDRIALLTAHGAIFLNNGRGSDPSINSHGQICYVIPASDKSHPFFRLITMSNFKAARRTVYKQRVDITANHWGPGKAIALVSGSHYPGTQGPIPQLLVVRSDGKVTTINTGLKTLSNVIWSERAAGLAVSDWAGDGKLIGTHRDLRLPNGWLPASWSPSGSELLVWGPRSSIGVWRPGHPGTVHVIGRYSASHTVVEFQWLSEPVKF